MAAGAKPSRPMTSSEQTALRRSMFKVFLVSMACLIALVVVYPMLPGVTEQDENDVAWVVFPIGAATCVGFAVVGFRHRRAANKRREDN